MKYTIHLISFNVLCVVCIGLFFAGASVAFADHGDEESNESHATTIHADESVHVETADNLPVTITPTYSPIVDVNRVMKMQELLKALQQLVVLLELQKEQRENEHTHNDDDHA